MEFSRYWPVIGLLFAIMILAACQPSATNDLPANVAPPTEESAAGEVATPVPTAALRQPETEAVPSPELPTPAPTEDPQASLAGRYAFRPLGDDQMADYHLVLHPDGTAEIDERLVGSDEETVEATGTWHVEDGSVVFDVAQIRGREMPPGTSVRIQAHDGFPVVSEIQVGDELIHLENAAFSLGAGESNPLVGDLNRRLAAVDFLGYEDPGTDIYSEAVRQAVVAFQETQGLVPDGVVTAETWLLLGNPQPPAPTLTPLPAPSEPITGVPDLTTLPANTEDGSPILYFTFDDGPYPENTPTLLQVLAENDVEATFFNLGKSVVTWPEIVRDAASGGHYIANHTWDHATLKDMTHEEFVHEVGRTKDAILDAAGDLFGLDKNVRYVRPPYGETDANTRQYAAQSGYAVVLWSIDTQDWRRPGADVIADYLLTSAYPGAIVLMHDGGGDRSQTIEALRTALPQLKEQGYVFRNIFLP